MAFVTTTTEGGEMLAVKNKLKYKKKQSLRDEEQKNRTTDTEAKADNLGIVLVIKIKHHIKVGQIRREMYKIRTRTKFSEIYH